MVDIDENRLEQSKKFGATHTINSKDADHALKQLFELTDGGRGVNVSDRILCQKMISPGGRIANVGVHGAPVDLQLQDLWIKNITLTTGLVNTNTLPLLLKTIESGKLKPQELVTHTFTFENILEAYDTFANASKEKALKMIIDFNN